MADFKTSHKIVMLHEGGYANNPVDTGGETYKGIARKRHPNWSGWADVDAAKKLFSKASALDIFLQGNDRLQLKVLAFYKQQFWDELNLDKVISQEIATELYDTGVNMGTGVAALFLQTALNVSNRNGKDYVDLKKDAKIGPNTVNTLNIHQRPADVLKVLNCLQGSRYIDIMERNPGQEIFFRSWFSRVTL